MAEPLRATSNSEDPRGANHPPGPKQGKPFLRRHRWIAWIAGVALVTLAALTLTFFITARHFEPYLRARIIEGLEQRFHTRVELQTFHVEVHHGQQATWGLWARGRGLRIWPPHRDGGDHPLETAIESKPLIDLGEFSFHVPLSYQMTQTKRVKIPEVRLKNLQISIPPPSARDKQTGLESAVKPSPSPQQPGTLANVTVERVTCDGASITLETDKPDKVPMVFDIAHLTLTHLRAGEPMAFQAELTNPKPKGLIHSAGSFGPWIAQDPGESPVNGSYTFDNADLSTFNGLAGTLQSTGSYTGTLRDMTVDGKSDVPDFRLTHFGNSVPLHTKFHARVDGTNGDTWLEPVDATLGTSHFITRGKIVRVKLMPDQTFHRDKPSAIKQDATETSDTPRAAGHLIDLKVDIDRGHMADFLRLVGKSAQPLLTGDVSAHAMLHIPPGPEPPHLRMKLDGSFNLDDAKFTSDKMQGKIEELSLRGQGQPGDVKKTDPDSIRSHMEGEFHMAHGVITLPNLQYAVPGALIQLAGTYALDGPLKFDGTARMQATLSQMVGGWKGFLLKPVDRFFKKDGAGALIPIKIRGTRDNPDFGVDLGRIGHTAPERPDMKPPAEPARP